MTTTSQTVCDTHIVVADGIQLVLTGNRRDVRAGRPHSTVIPMSGSTIKGTANGVVESKTDTKVHVQESIISLNFKLV